MGIAMGMDKVISSDKWFLWSVTLIESFEHGEKSGYVLHVVARTHDEAVEIALYIESPEYGGDGYAFVHSVVRDTQFWFPPAFLEEISKSDDGA